MKTNWTNTLLGLFLLASAGVGGVSCSKQVTRADTNTNWLRTCVRDSECGSSLECVCGVCTISCDASSACREFENGACTPTRSCSDASAVCASKEGFEALSLPPASAADPGGDGGSSSILCSRSVEDYVVQGSCAGIDIDCAAASETRSGDSYFEDDCGCGCTEALGFGGSGSGGSGNGSGGSGGRSTGGSNGSGGSSGSVGGRSSGGNSPVGGMFHSLPAGGNGTGGASSIPTTGSFGSPTGSIGGAPPTGFDDSFFNDPVCNIPPRDFDPQGVECDDALRDYSKGSKSQCGRNNLGEGLVQSGGFNDDCGCGCWDASPETCDDEARHYVSRDRDGECQNHILACGALDPFIDVCGCGCWKPSDPEALPDAYLPFEVSQCPAPPAGDEVSYELFDLSAFGCDEGTVFGTDSGTIRNEEEFRSVLSACSEDPDPSGLDFSESTLVVAAIEDSPHLSVRYVVVDDAGSVNFGVTAYQYCGTGVNPRGMVAFVVDAEVSRASASTCYLMTCQSLAP